MGLVPNREFMRINTKSSRVFSMLKLPNTKIGAGLLNISCVACPARMGGAS